MRSGERPGQMSLRVGVAGIIPRGDKVLVLRRAATASFLPGSFDLPGGKLEFGEPPEDGVRREVLEETGISTSVARILGAKSYLVEGGKKHTILIVYLLRPQGNSFQVTLSKEHDDYAWVGRSDLERVFRTGVLPETSKPDLIQEIIREYFDSGLVEKSV